MIFHLERALRTAMAVRGRGFRADLVRGVGVRGSEGMDLGKWVGPKANRGGFVLLEILMAIALFSTVSVAMVQALGQIADTSMVARREALMVGRLDSAITEAANRVEWEEGTWSTERDAFGISVTTRIDRAELWNREGVALEGIWRVGVEVVWSDGARSESRFSETYVNEKLSNRDTG